MKERKIYKAYAEYGKHPLADSRVFVQVSQHRKRYQCKPVSKLYVRKKVDKGTFFDDVFLVKALMRNGYSYEESMEKVRKK